MKREQVDQMERLMGQLKGHHSEIAALTKRASNDAVNAFKLKYINATVISSNKLLGDKYKPFGDFAQFDVDEVPSNSDVTFIIAQYIEAVEKYRADNIHQSLGDWYYTISDSEEKIEAAPPARLKK